ncbi:MAG: nuclear transport factor 2 family protein [Actinobacteria bacterium]|nr:nuclear transport factor 2 family protein [Actinomycetota bacterium]
MERSAELEAITRRWLSAFTESDVEAVLAPLSDSEDVVWVGTDPGEEWWGRKTVEPLVRRQYDEIGGSLRGRTTGVWAWSEGTVGWVFATRVLELEPDPLPMRVTAVFHLEHGQWRVVHTVFSLAILNEESFGLELTTSVDLIAQAVEVERPDLDSAAAPDGTVTLLFTDIEGSTERNATLGDGEWMSLLRKHHDLVREQVVAHGGFEVKSMGDGFMIAFSSARRALQCATDIQRVVEKDPALDIRIRAGLHAGEAVRLGDDFYGGVVNMAARVAGSAAGGEVLVSTIVKALVESSGEFVFDTPRSTELKGFAGTHELHPLLL